MRLSEILQDQTRLNDALTNIIRDGYFDYEQRRQRAIEKNKFGNYKSPVLLSRKLVKREPLIRKSIEQYLSNRFITFTETDMLLFEEHLSNYLLKLMRGQLAEEVTRVICENAISNIIKVRDSTPDEDRIFGIDFWIGTCPVQVKHASDFSEFSKDNWNDVYKKRFLKDMINHRKNGIFNAIYVLAYLEDTPQGLGINKHYIIWFPGSTAQEGIYRPINGMGNSGTSKKTVETILKNYLKEVSIFDQS